MAKQMSFPCPTCQARVSVPESDKLGAEFKRRCRKCRREWLLRIACAGCGTTDNRDHAQTCAAAVPAPVAANFHARKLRVPTGPGHYQERRFM